MSIPVYEALKLNYLKPLVLVAGEGGLNKHIDKIGILDHEIIEGVKQMFRPGDFVLTTFTPIRNDIKAIETCIRDLGACKISALAIKNIYVKELSPEIINFANALDFPIFIFDKDIYFEDIIEDLMLGMQTRSHIEILESKIEILFVNKMKPDLVLEMALDLNQYFNSWHQVFFLKEKRYINNEKNILIADKYRRSRKQSIEHSVFKYRDGLMIIMTYDKHDEKVHLDCDYLFKRLNISPDDYFMGSSTMRSSLTSLDSSIKEAVYALEVCEIEQVESTCYSEIGIYQLLLPHKDSWMQQYIQTILTPIYNYDDGKLIETARTYIKNKGDLVVTANELFQHKNTIRYRVQKMKELLNTSSDGDFYEQLSIAIKCEKIM